MIFSSALYFAFYTECKKAYFLTLIQILDLNKNMNFKGLNRFGTFCLKNIVLKYCSFCIFKLQKLPKISYFRHFFLLLTYNPSNLLCMFGHCVPVFATVAEGVEGEVPGVTPVQVGQGHRLGSSCDEGQSFIRGVVVASKNRTCQFANIFDL